MEPDSGIIEKIVVGDESFTRLAHFATYRCSSVCGAYASLQLDKMQLVVERDHSSTCKQTASTFKGEDIEKFGEKLPPNAIDDTAAKLKITIDGHTYSRSNTSRLFICTCKNVYLALNTARTYYKITKGQHTPGCGQGYGYPGRGGQNARRLQVDFDKDGDDIDESALQPSKNDVQKVIYDNRPWTRTYRQFICPCKAVSLVINDEKSRVVVQPINNRSHRAACGQNWRKANGIE